MARETTGAAVRRSDADARDSVSHRLLAIELHRDDRSLPSRIAAPAPGDLVAQVTFGPRRRSVGSNSLSTARASCQRHKRSEGVGAEHDADRTWQ